jgi:hypothetical protein
MFLYKHYIIGAHLDTYVTARASIRVHSKCFIFKMNGILRAIVGTNTALVADLDAVIPRSREPSLDSQ